MRNFKVLVVGLVLTMSEAFAGDWTLSANIGMANGDANMTSLNNQIFEKGLDVTASSSDHNRTAWQFLLGYQYTPEVGVEIGYVDLGEVSTILNGSTTDVDALLNSVSDIHPLTAYGWQLTGTYRFPIEATTSVVFRAGLLDWQSKYKLETTNASHTVTGKGSSGIFGAGIEKDIGQNKKLNFTYSWYDIDGESISVLGVGFTYTVD